MQTIALPGAKDAPMGGETQSLAVTTRTWQSFCSREYGVPEGSRAQPVPCSVLARWLLLQHLRESLENLESKIIRCAFYHCHPQQQK